MRCLVTGITGFVGAHLTKFLLAQGNEVIGTANDASPSAGDANPKLYRCEISDMDGLTRLVQDSRPDQAYHLAALSSPVGSLANERAVYEINFLGTLNLLEAIRCAAPRARVLLVGSTQCYGVAREAELPLREEQPFAPRNPYAVSKAAADLLGFQFFALHGLYVVRARPANHTGPGQTDAFVCSNFARQLAAIELGLSAPTLRVGNIDVSRDFCDVRDVVRAYARLLEKGHPGEAYNIGTGNAVTLRQIVDILKSFCSRPVQVIVDGRRVRPDDAKSLYVSAAKIAAHTGWAPEWELRATLRDLFDYWMMQLKASA